MINTARPVMVDPPEGWRYGFPKLMPVLKEGESEHAWFLAQGYPQKLIDQGMLNHCRWWYG